MTNRSAICVALAVMLTSPVTHGAEAKTKLYAAGSLTGAMTAVIKLYKQKTGIDVEADFGPAGLMRERIEKGDRADVFASANMAHPQKLAAAGRATQPVVMARNRLCARALPAFKLTSANLLERMLDPQVGIGTSTPIADPGGDYTWEMFKKADAVRPGARAILEKKAQQIVGGKDNPPVPEGKNATDYYFEQNRIHVSIGYCSSRQTTPDPRYTQVELPANLATTADYGLSVLNPNAPGRDGAYRFALFVMSPEAQQVIAQYGFTTVAEAKAE